MADRAAAAPRLAVLARNQDTGRQVVRVHSLPDGTQLAALFYNPNFDAVDVLPIPQAGTSHYAILTADPAGGLPYKVEIRAANNALIGNFWLGAMPAPRDFALAEFGAAGPGLRVLGYEKDARLLKITHIDLGTAARTSVRFSNRLAPVAMLELPDRMATGTRNSPSSARRPTVTV